MFKSLLLISLSISALFVQAQDKPKASPPATTTGTIAGSTITINYSQPSVKGRKIWGELVPYGKVWRTGANEATTFETSKNITVAGQALPAGKYSLFTIPGENEWTIILNNEAEQFGAFTYKEKKDKIRFYSKPAKAPAFTEKMTFLIEGSQVKLRWENLEIAFPVAQ
ncbi:MAG: DUF2911 domain-containing protein [Opitutaceae bacterium]|nr:DUF2911 domain-containing protein [Cytophagales bacterium]